MPANETGSLWQKICPLFRKIEAILRERVPWVFPLMEQIFFPRPSAKWVRALILAFFGIFLVWGTFVFVLDPYICFHRALGWKQVYTDAYASIPGVLRHVPYDTVLIGSSMCKNFRISEIDRSFRCRSVKAVASGMTGDDVGRIIRLLLTERRKPLKRILLGLDVWAFCKGPGNGHWRSRQYLYDRPFSWEYFLSTDSFGAAFNVIVSNLAPAGTKGAELEKDFDMMFGDKLWRFTFSREVLENSLRCKIEYLISVRPDTVPLVESLVLDPAKKCPEIQVDVFFPPYSIFFWTVLQDCGMLEEYLDARIKIAEKIALCSNVRLHDFQSDPDIICQLDNYRDLTHFSPAVTTRILAGMTARKYVADPLRVRAGSDAIRKMTGEWFPRFKELSSNPVASMVWRVR